MGFMENVAAFYIKRTQEFADTVQTARDKASKGSYKLDDYFSDNLKLWLNAYSDWSGLFPFLGVDPAPILYANLDNSDDFEGLVAVAPLPSPTPPLKGTQIVPLFGTGQVNAADVLATDQGDGTIKVKFPHASALIRPGVFHGVIYYTDSAGNPHMVAALLLHKL